MKIKNEEVKLFAELIISIPLKGMKSILRTRLFNILKNHLENVIDLESTQLVKEYVAKDSDGNELFLDNEKTKYKMNPEFNIEIEKLLNQKLVIENNEANKDMLINICEVLLDEDLDINFLGETAILYNEWYEECQNIIEEYNKK